MSGGMQSFIDLAQSLRQNAGSPARYWKIPGNLRSAPPPFNSLQFRFADLFKEAEEEAAGPSEPQRWVIHRDGQKRPGLPQEHLAGVQ